MPAQRDHHRKVMRPGSLVRAVAVSVFLLISFTMRGQITGGLEFKRLMNLNLVHLDSTTTTDVDNRFNSTWQLSGGYGFGMSVRLQLTEMWNMESGISYTARKINYRLKDLKTDFTDDLDFKMVSYEIPLKGLVYLRLGENFYADVALGISADFYASNVEAVQNVGTDTSSISYRTIGSKNSWIQMAAIGSLGFEYRTEESGFFYIGASYHASFSPIMSVGTLYYPEGPNQQYYSSYIGSLDGAYFSIDLRYYLMPKKIDNTPKVVIPNLGKGRR